jgi:hypothetical protein
MMNDMQSQEEDLADNIIDIGAYQAPMPVVKPFLPWHRPRKQYVRHHQWCYEIGEMLDATPLLDGTLKYLGLPGLDLLDLRHFHSELCTPRGIKLRFLGFNSSARPSSSDSTELNVSLDEVRRLSNVDPMSLLIGDNFALVAHENSIACREARKLGPFDVINLDLCDGFGAQAPGQLSDNYYNAVNSLFALQARSKSPWLLLLTTRADRQNVDAAVLEALLTKFIENLASCQTFQAASRERFAIETADAAREAIERADGLLSIFLTGLCKWFVGLALANQPPTLVELRSVIGYRVNPAATHEDLISLALKFTPTFIPAADPLGLADQQANLPNECTLATRAIRNIARREDADRKLAEDAQLNQNMIDATAQLLGLARYNPDDYKAWLQSL